MTTITPAAPASSAFRDMFKISGVVAWLSLAFALAVLLSLWMFQTRIIYPGAGGARPEPRMGWTEISIQSQTHGKLYGYHFPARPGKPTIVFAHGNGTTFGSAAIALESLTEGGIGVLMPEYPGYGGNPGKPDEAGLTDAVISGIRWLDTIGEKRSSIVVLGNSIGTGPAIQAARQAPDIKGLIIVSGVANLGAVIRTHLPFIPDLMIDELWENDKGIADIKAPVHIIHGDSDTLVPLAQGERLARSAGTKVQLIPGGHEIAFYKPVHDAILAQIDDWTFGPPKDSVSARGR